MDFNLSIEHQVYHAANHHCNHHIQSPSPWLSYDTHDDTPLFAALAEKFKNALKDENIFSRLKIFEWIWKRNELKARTNDDRGLKIIKKNIQCFSITNPHFGCIMNIFHSFTSLCPWRFYREFAKSFDDGKKALQTCRKYLKGKFDALTPDKRFENLMNLRN